MLSLTAMINTKEGLHSRAAAAFVQQTNKYICDIYLNYDEKTVDAKSIMGILSLGIASGKQIIVTFDGIDETQAKTGIETLITTELVSL